MLSSFNVCPRGQWRLRKPATAQTQTLCAILLGQRSPNNKLTDDNALPDFYKERNHNHKTARNKYSKPFQNDTTMTIRTFWTIFIKILGIWLVLGSVTVIPQFFLTSISVGSNKTAENFALVAALLLLTIGIYIFILQLFVFKTSWLIDKLHLDKGFDEEKLDLNVQLSTVLTVTTIVLGGLMFVDSLPQLCKQTFKFFQEGDIFSESPTSGWIIFHFVNTILGYLLMTNSKQVVEFIHKQTATQNDN